MKLSSIAFYTAVTFLALSTLGSLLKIAGVAETPRRGAAAIGDKSWVTVDRLPRRTCGSDSCGSVGSLFFREGVEPKERAGNWVRISDYYPAPCEANRLIYVDEGDAECSQRNGFKDGKIAEWVLAEHLSLERPADPAQTATDAEKLIAQSDDFHLYRDVFTAAANRLLANGKCTAADFKEIGGWIKSTERRNEPVYFTYCGGMTLSNKIYLDARSGEVSR